MMKLNLKKARYISYLLLFTMIFQSFAPYIPVVELKRAEEKNKIKEEGRRKDSVSVEKEKKAEEIQSSGFDIPPRIEITPSLTATLYSSDLKEGEIGLISGKNFDNPEDNVFSVYMDQLPAKNQKVYLSYELYGIADKSGISRSINDRISRGGYLVKTNSEWTHQREQLHSGWIQEGGNQIYFTIPANAAYGYKIKNLKIEVENKETQTKEIVTESYAYKGGDTYVKGFIADTQNREVKINGQKTKVYQGEFELLLKGMVEEIEVEAAGKTELFSTVLAKDQPDYSYSVDLNLSQKQEFFKKGNQQNTLSYLGAVLEVEGSQLILDKSISVQNLRSRDLPALDMGLQNVTSQADGYRFLPHGEHFTKGAVVKLTYDRTKIPNGYTEQDIRTYYFDLKTKHWIALERDSIDTKNQLVISKTTHFTDMINGVIQAPESPETAGFTPTMMSDIKAANPLAKLNLISPPQANNRGSAATGYSFEMPPARNGMAPSLGIQYSSDGGSGWLGEGWDLNVPGISVETRWGVPRYDVSLETETYLMEGSQLVTKGPDGNSSIAHRGDKIPRESDRYFSPRKEGSFAKIQRKGSSPVNYTWEVTDRKGTKYTYGGNNGVVKGNFTNVAGQTKEVISEWKLSRIEELHGDWVEYIYEQLNEPVRGGLTSQALYLKEVQAGNKGDTPHTVVKLVRGKQKQKQTSSARYGYLTSQNSLLTQVEVNFEGQKLREYNLEYTEGEFFTDLLDKVTHNDNQGNYFTSQTFEYYNDVKEAGTYFKETEEWNTHDDGISAGFINPISRVQQTGDFSDKATALGGSKSTSKSGSVYVGIGLNDGKLISKSNTVGASFNYSYSEGKGLSTLVDINGDGIPDKVYVSSGSMYYRAGNSKGEFGNPIKIMGASQFSTTYTNSTSFGVKANLAAGPVLASVGIDEQTSKTKVSRYFTDINGDGLVDLVVGGSVYFNHLEKDDQGNLTIPTFTLSSGDTPSPIKGGGSIDDTDTGVDEKEQAELIANNPLQDAVRVWIAPYDGMVNVSGTVRLLRPEGEYEDEALAKADGVRIAIQHKGTEVNSILIRAEDFASKNIGVNSLLIKAGERIYFRVQSGIKEDSNGQFDQVDWSPVVTYTDITGTDVNGYTPVYSSQSEITASDQGVVVLPEIDQYTIKSTFVKLVTSDRVTLKVMLGENQIVYEKTFETAETYNGSIEIPVSNPQLINYLQFSIQSPTNIAWEKIQWNPEVHYTTQVDIGNGVIQEYEQSLIGTVLHNTTYESMVKPGGSHSVANKGTGKLLTTLTPKVGITPEEINKINGTFDLKVKDASGTFYTGKLVLTNGVITTGTEQLVSLPQGKIGIELYTSDSNTDGIRNLASVQTKVIDTLNASTNALTAVYRNWSLQGYGPLHRQWGQFSYNAMGGRSKMPINESLLKLPETENDPNADPMKMVFIPMHLDMGTKRYWEGNDSEVYIKETVMSASRLGQKDVILDNPLSGLGETGSEETRSCITGGGAIGVRNESKSTSTSVMTGVNEGTRSEAKGEDEIRLTFADMNGDGYPDIVSKSQVQLTNTRGGFDGEIVKHDGYHRSKSKSNSIGLGGNPVHAMSIISKANDTKLANAIKNNASKSEVDKAAKAAENSKIVLEKANNFSLIPSGNISDNSDEVVESFTDVNGDGLPDKILSNKQVRLNLGYAFTQPIDWELDRIQEGSNTDVGANLGFSINASSISGGIGINNTKANADFTMIDVNGDGLVDKVRVSGGTVHISLNKGNSFAPEMEWKGMGRANRNSSVGESANVAFTVGIPIPIINLKISINPGVSVGSSMSRTLDDMKDVDGDGFLDVVSSDKERSLKVKRSTIERTNKLKTVSNSIGGSFTLNYARTEATYDHPGGKWVLSSVEMDDGIWDDGANSKVGYKYSQGKHDRHEREFLGFGKVETLSIDTENSNQVYRKSIEEYDVSDYYRAGNHLKSTVEDAAGNKYAETLNKYYHYEVRQIGSNNYSITNTELCFDNQSVYTPLKYTQSKVYEGTPNGIIANESYYIYDITNQYGELKSYKYSDKGSLEESGTGDYNYETRMTYTSNPAKNIYGLPIEVKVSGSDGKLYRHVEAAYDLNYANHMVEIVQQNSGEESETHIDYDLYGNIIQKILPGIGSRVYGITYKYRYDQKYNMYVERIDDSNGYTSLIEDYDYRYGIPLSVKDYNGYFTDTTIDGLGRIKTITGPNEMELGLYTIKFEYSPIVSVSDKGEIIIPAHALTRQYYPQQQYPGDDIETYSYVDGMGRSIQIKKDGVITETDANGSNPKDKEVRILSGRNKLDPFGRIIESYYPITEEPSNTFFFNKTFDDVTPTKIRYDILDRAVGTILPDGSTSQVEYTLDTGSRNLVTTITDALGGKQKTYTNGSGLTLKTEQLSGPNGTITTRFGYDLINQLLTVIDTEGQVTTSEYDIAGRRTKITHPSAGTTLLTYNPAGNITTRQTSNLEGKGQTIKYEYDPSNRLVGIHYPEHPKNNISYYYGNKNAKENRIGRLMLIEDATGAQEFKYGTLGEVTEVRRTVIIPNQAIATYVTKTKYDSWNRIEQIIYPDEEKVEYSYNTAGLLTGVKGSKAYSYNYVEKIGYDKFEQRNYLKYCNGAETAYTYDPQRRRLTDLQVWTDPSTNGTSQGIRHQIMNNQYTYDAVSNVLSTSNLAPLPQNTQSNQGGQMKHEYSYDGLYRLIQAKGTYSGADAKTADYTLNMSYDNLHNITAKKQDLSQQNIMFTGGLKAGYDLAYTYNSTKKNQIEIINDINYRTEAQDPKEKKEEKKAYEYDANGNLIYVNTSLKKQDLSISDKTGERKLKWDEENRLKAIDDNGFVSNYWYDASGERIVKSSGGSEQVYVNSLSSGGNTSTSNFTAYISPYLVISPNGKYTKHYYIGSQRIVSKLGDMESFGADPRRIEYAGAGLPGVEIDWKGKYQGGIQEIKDAYAHFEVPYNGTDNDDYVNGAGLCCSPNQKISPFEAGIGTGNVNYEKLQYYYHPDHLGSSSYITNLDGAVVQHIEYIPFGEVFVEERNNSWNTPYLFNAKELDEETGLYYYGARYYDPKISVWLSTDPLSGYNPVFEVEHYIDGQHNGGVFNSFNHNTYGYTYQNPVLYVDPNGKQNVSPTLGLDSSSLLDASNFNTSTPKTTGALYGVGRTLNWLGNNSVPVSGKPGTEAGTVTKGTSRASQYLRYNTSWGAEKLPKGLQTRLPKKISVPILGSTPVRTDTWGGLAGRGVPVVGRGLIGFNIGLSGYNIMTAENSGRQAVKEGFIWSGAIAGGEVGATMGSAAGPGGAFVGGVIGGVAGGVLGESVFGTNSCNGCVKSNNNYLEEGMKMDGGLRSIQDRLKEKEH